MLRVLSLSKQGFDFPHEFKKLRKSGWGMFIGNVYTEYDYDRLYRRISYPDFFDQCARYPFKSYDMTKHATSRYHFPHVPNSMMSAMFFVGVVTTLNGFKSPLNVPPEIAYEYSKMIPEAPYYMLLHAAKNNEPVRYEKCPICWNTDTEGTVVFLGEKWEACRFCRSAIQEMPNKCVVCEDIFIDHIKMRRTPFAHVPICDSCIEESYSKCKQCKRYLSGKDVDRLLKIDKYWVECLCGAPENKDVVLIR